MNKYKYIFGTSHFPSQQAARRYYFLVSKEVVDVSRMNQIIELKIKDNSISIGRPVPRADEEVFLSPSEGRYFIGVKI